MGKKGLHTFAGALSATYVLGVVQWLNSYVYYVLRINLMPS